MKKVLLVLGFVIASQAYGQVGIGFLKSLNQLADNLSTAKNATYGDDVNLNAATIRLIQEINRTPPTESGGAFLQVYKNLPQTSVTRPGISQSVSKETIDTLLNAARREMYNYMLNNMETLVNEPEFFNIMGNLISGKAFVDAKSIDANTFAAKFLNLAKLPDIISDKAVRDTINKYINDRTFTVKTNVNEIAGNILDITDFLTKMDRYNSKVQSKDIAAKITNGKEIALRNFQQLNQTINNTQQTKEETQESLEEMRKALNTLSNFNKQADDPKIAATLVNTSIEDYVLFSKYPGTGASKAANTILRETLQSESTSASIKEKIEGKLIRKMNKLKEDALNQKNSKDRATALEELAEMAIELREVSPKLNKYTDSTMQSLVKQVGLETSGISSIIQRIKEFFGFDKDRATVRQANNKLGDLTSSTQKLGAEGTETKGAEPKTGLTTNEPTQKNFDDYGKEGDKDEDKYGIGAEDYA